MYELDLVEYEVMVASVTTCDWDMRRDHSLLSACLVKTRATSKYSIECQVELFVKRSKVEDVV